MGMFEDRRSGSRQGLALALVPCGGVGREFAHLLEVRLGERPALATHVVDTQVPPGVPSSRCTQLRPDLLPTTATGRIAEYARFAGLSADDYRSLRGLVSADGMARLPAMTIVTGLVEFEALKAALEATVRGAARAMGGATRCQLVTVASTVGGTGTPAALVTGWAARLAAMGHDLPGSLRWTHVAVTTTLLGDDVRVRRTLALEHQRLLEFEALMRPNAELRLPGVTEPICAPGPDQLVLVASAADAPRTCEEAADEFAEVLANWLN